MKKTGSEWLKYDFQELERGHHSLSDVTHIAHWSHARGIIKDEKIKKGSIRENGRLKDIRSRVCWFSCNVYLRSVYGTIAFSFPCEKLVKGKDIYWIEASKEGEQTTLRFFLRDRGKPRPLGLTLYDPTQKRGPLKKRGGKWYFCTDNRIVGHFLVERNVPLAWCHRITAIDHHPSFCKLNAYPCPESRIERAATCAKIISYLIGTGNTKINHLICPVVSGRQIIEMLEWSAVELANFIQDELGPFDGSSLSTRAADSLFKEIALHFSQGNITKVKHKSSLFESADVFEETVYRLMSEHFKVDKNKVTDASHFLLPTNLVNITDLLRGANPV